VTNDPIQVEGKTNSRTSNFYLKSRRVKVKKGGTELLPVTFIPLIKGQHRCVLVFVDQIVGEIQHEIVATVDLPLVNPEYIIKPPQLFVE
jgi:hypothetical protein